jgi:hypothetical protein
MASPPKGGPDQRQGSDLKLLVVALVTSAAWVVLDWARGAVLDVERLITGGLFVLTLLVAWRGLEMSFAALRRHYELKTGLKAFDERTARIEGQFRRLGGE